MKMVRLSHWMLVGLVTGLWGCGVAPWGKGSQDREAGNGGDPIELLFSEQRSAAVKLTTAVNERALRSVANQEIRDWLLENSKKLALDVEKSKHVWSNKHTPTCAETGLKPLADILLSYPTCRAGNINEKTARRILIHESVHHFGISDEQFSDEVAITITDLLSPEYFVEKDEPYECVNQYGERRWFGGNPDYIGPCGELGSLDLRGADLSGLDLRNSEDARDLTNANLQGAILTHVYWVDVNVDGAKFAGAAMKNTNFRGGSAVGTDFTGLNVDGIELREADVRDASFKGSIIRDLYGTDADFEGVDFSGAVAVAQMNGANLRNADFTNADFRRADFTGANMEGAKVEGTNLRMAEYDASTTLPFSEEEARRRGMVNRP